MTSPPEPEQGFERNPDGTFTTAGARAAASKGGQTYTDLKRFARAMSRRKWCTASCQIYDRCPVRVIAMDQEPDERGRVTCAMKEIHPPVRAQIIRTFFEGRDGLIEQIMTVLYRHAEAVEDRQIARKLDGLGPDPYLFAHDARLLMDFYKIIYGEKRAIDLSGGVDVVPELPDDPDLYREIGDLLAKRMNTTVVDDHYEEEDS